jgi:hypothetical protein
VSVRWCKGLAYKVGLIVIVMQSQNSKSKSQNNISKLGSLCLVEIFYLDPAHFWIYNTEIKMPRMNIDKQWKINFYPCKSVVCVEE